MIVRAAILGPRLIKERRQIKKELDVLAKDQFQFSRPKMALMWGLGAGAAGLAGIGIQEAWKALDLPTHFGPAGMLIGGFIGGATTYLMIGDDLPLAKRLGLSVAAGAGAAALYHTAGLQGVKEGVAMTVGGAIGAAVGYHSLPDENKSVLNALAAGTFGLGICHVAGIVGASGPMGKVGAALFPVLGATAGHWIATGNRHHKADEIRARLRGK